MKDSTTPYRYNESSLVDQLLKECEAMAQYAFASGLEVPGENVQTIVAFADQNLHEDETLTKNDIHPLQYQFDNNISQLVTTHNTLAQIVKPATPRAIMLLTTESAKGKFWKFVGLVPQVRRMMFVTILFVIAFIIIPLSASVDGRAGDPLNSDGMELLLNELYFISAAGIGASLYLLFKVNNYIIKGKYDPKYEPYYWIRFILGLITGLILAALIPDIPLIEEENLALARPTLALLGGFSAAGVYSILESLMDKIKSRAGVEKMTKKNEHRPDALDKV